MVVTFTSTCKVKLPVCPFVFSLLPAFAVVCNELRHYQLSAPFIEDKTHLHKVTLFALCTTLCLVITGCRCAHSTHGAAGTGLSLAVI